MVIIRKCLKPTKLYEEARSRLVELKNVNEELTKNKKENLKGKLKIIKNRGNIQYYVRKNPSESNGEYISKRKEKVIKEYVKKKYNEDVLKLVLREICVLEEFLNKSNSIDNLIKNKYSNYPSEVKKYINPIDMSDLDFVNDWIADEYIRKAIGDEETILISDKGDHVRSKSELNIANFLFKMNIPYKYECPLTLYNGRTIYPDFTVLDVKRRKQIYWEHRGMMDNMDYTKHAVQRIKDYMKSGIIIGDTLIITEESSVAPLGTNEIELIINHYFV